jgi:hypothetical protein
MDWFEAIIYRFPSILPGPVSTSDGFSSPLWHCETIKDAFWSIKWVSLLLLNAKLKENHSSLVWTFRKMLFIAMLLMGELWVQTLKKSSIIPLSFQFKLTFSSNIERTYWEINFPLKHKRCFLDSASSIFPRICRSIFALPQCDAHNPKSFPLSSELAVNVSLHVFITANIIKGPNHTRMLMEQWESLIAGDLTAPIHPRSHDNDNCKSLAGSDKMRCLNQQSDPRWWVDNIVFSPKRWNVDAQALVPKKSWLC